MIHKRERERERTEKDKEKERIRESDRPRSSGNHGLSGPRGVINTTGTSASNSKPASSGKRQDSASKPGPSTASRLGIVKQSLRDRQFSSDVAEHVSKARRESTVKVYDAKWQIFRDWAMLRSTSPKLEGNRLLKSMMQNGKSSVIGQINEETVEISEVNRCYKL